MTPDSPTPAVARKPRTPPAPTLHTENIPMKNRFVVMRKEDFDEEMNALCAITLILSKLTFAQQHRILSYVIMRHWRQCWWLGKPQE